MPMLTGNVYRSLAIFDMCNPFISIYVAANM